MAMPIWGIWMKKVLADGTLGISETDRFVSPPGMHLNLDCDGSDNDAQMTERDMESYYFD